MTPAEEILTAADTLNARAAAATPGPWRTNLNRARGPADIHNTSGRPVIGEWATHAGDAAWIATLHPGVAPILAGWLHQHGRDLTRAGHPHYCDSPPDLEVALRLARTINGQDRP